MVVDGDLNTVEGGQAGEQHIDAGGKEEDGIDGGVNIFAEGCSDI